MSNAGSGNDQIFAVLYELIEWTFDLRLTADDREIFEAEVFRGWDNADDTDHDLISYLLQLKDTIWSAPAHRRKQVKPQARSLFQKVFGIRESNDRGRIVGTLHSLLERRSPGSTGVAGAAPLRVAPALSVPAQPVPPMPQPMMPQPMPPPYPAVAMDPYASVNPAAQPQMGDMNSMLERLKSTNRHSQMVGLQTAIQKAEHDSIMGIIRSMG